MQIPETGGRRTFGEEPYFVGGRALLAQVVPRLQRIRQDDGGQHQQRSRPQRLQSFTLFCSGQGVDSGLCLFSKLTVQFRPEPVRQQRSQPAGSKPRDAFAAGFCCHLAVAGSLALEALQHWQPTHLTKVGAGNAGAGAAAGHLPRNAAGRSKLRDSVS